jgi:hypothetical protein
VKLGKTAADLDTGSVTKAAKRAQAAGSAAAANAADAAQNAAAAAQNAVGVTQSAAKNAADAAQSAAKNAAEVAQTAADRATDVAHNVAEAAQTAADKAADLAQTAVGASRVAADKAADVAQNASEAAQAAAVTVSKNVKDKVFTARKWAAPRLETAADYTTATVAPKVSSALRTAAEQVQPDTGRSKRKIVLWSVFGVAAAAGAAVAAVVFRNRFKAAIAADSEAADEEVLADPVGSTPAPVVVLDPDSDTADVMPVTDIVEPAAGSAAPAESDGTEPAAGQPVDPDGDASVNGRVNSTGW